MAKNISPLIQAKIYWSALRTYFRNILNKKAEDEAPYLVHIIQKDDVCLHIGATDGRHSYMMARSLKNGKGRIYAFEPSPITFSILKKVIRMHQLEDKIVADQKAFSDQTRELVLNVPIKNTGRIAHNFGFTSQPGERVIGRNGEKNANILHFPVQAVTIDSIVSGTTHTVDFIRMDIEGSEQLALRGGWKTIEQFKPHILIEIHPKLLREKFGADPQTIYDDFIRLGYHIYHLEKGNMVRSASLNIEPWKDYFFINPDRPHTLPLPSSNTQQAK